MKNTMTIKLTEKHFIIYPEGDGVFSVETYNMGILPEFFPVTKVAVEEIRDQILENQEIVNKLKLKIKENVKAIKNISSEMDNSNYHESHRESDVVAIRSLKLDAYLLNSILTGGDSL